MKKLLNAAIITLTLSMLTACDDSTKPMDIEPIRSNAKDGDSRYSKLNPEETKIQKLLDIYSKAYATRDYGTFYDVTTEQLDEVMTRDEFIKGFIKENSWIKKDATYKLKFIKMLAPYTDDDGQEYTKALVDVKQIGWLDDSLPEKYNGRGEVYLLESSNEYGYLIKDISYNDDEYEEHEANEYKTEVESSDNTTKPTEYESSNPSYETYTNSRFGFSVDVPTDLSEAEAPTNNDGRTFQNDDIQMIAYAHHINILEDNETIETYYKRKLEEITVPIAYKTSEDNWFVVSYVQDDKILYEKSIISDDIISSLSITYPADQKEKYDSMVTDISKSFKGATTEN